MFRKIITALICVITLVGLAACSQPPTEKEQLSTETELAQRGFKTPQYKNQHHGWSLYDAGFGGCRLNIGERDGSFAWLVERGNNEYWDRWVIGDFSLNAAWLRENPVGSAYSINNQKRVEYDLTPCLIDTPEVQARSNAFCSTVPSTTYSVS